MVAGVAGGMAEYFDIDASLVRLIWVAAAVVSHGLAIPIYILAWILLPREDRPPAATGPAAWRDWSHEFHDETHRLAEWSRQVAHEWHEPGPEQREQTMHEPPADPSTARDEPRAAATEKGMPVEPVAPPPTWAPPMEPPPAWAPPPGEPAPTAWDQSTRDLEPHHHHRPRSAGIVLVGLGVLLLAANAGLFSMIEWQYTWPLVFIGLGVVLLARQTDWFGRS
jgi:phage shock protein PspC (stress-responsive transcriptional regulator)